MENFFGRGFLLNVSWSRQNLFVCFFLVEESVFLFLLLQDNREHASELSVEVRSGEFGLA